jgi:hypothetical protein
MSGGTQRREVSGERDPWGYLPCEKFYEFAVVEKHPAF